jgi:hypothetical protein
MFCFEPDRRGLERDPDGVAACGSTGTGARPSTVTTSGIGRRCGLPILRRISTGVGFLPRMPRLSPEYEMTASPATLILEVATRQKERFGMSMKMNPGWEEAVKAAVAPAVLDIARQQVGTHVTCPEHGKVHTVHWTSMPDGSAQGRVVSPCCGEVEKALAAKMNPGGTSLNIASA